MKVLFDANVILDVYLDRAPWVTDSKAAFQLVLDSKVEGYLSAISLTTMYYLMRKSVGSLQALVFVGRAIKVFTVAEVDKTVLQAALQMLGPDFEDHVQAASGQHVGIDAVVTRDPAGFRQSSLRVVAPADLVALIA